VAARALFDADRDGALSYFAPVASMPGFPRALARTLEELALATLPASAVRALGDGGGDLAALFERFDEQFQSVCAVDRAAFLGRPPTRLPNRGAPMPRAASCFSTSQ
jgi:hypothetical protein